MTLRLFTAAACAGALMLMLAPPDAQAQRTVRIIVPYTPASGPDILSRLMAEHISRAGGPNMVVENRPGGGTVVGTEAAARAAPDGNTVLMVANSFAIMPAVKRGTYDVATSFDPVCYLAATPMVLVVQAASPYKTLEQLVDSARSAPGKIVFASGGPASSLHVAIEVLRLAAKIETTYVPYGGTAPAVNALMGGHVTAVWADYPTVVGQLKAGTLRALVTTSEKRVSTLPDVRTLKESGLSNYAADIFYGIVAPAKTPADELTRLAGWFGAAIKTPEVQPKLAQGGLFPVGMCGAPFGEFMRRITDDYVRIIREAKITVK